MAVVVVSHQLFRKYAAAAGRTHSEALKRSHHIWPTSPGPVARKYYSSTFEPQLEIEKSILVIAVEIFTSGWNWPAAFSLAL